MIHKKVLVCKPVEAGCLISCAKESEERVRDE